MFSRMKASLEPRDNEYFDWNYLGWAMLIAFIGGIFAAALSALIPWPIAYAILLIPVLYINFRYFWPWRIKNGT